MGRIASLIQDPVWWFSAFFIAIIASVVAGFAKDRIELWLGSISGRVRSHRQRQLVQKAVIVEALAKNEGFLIIAMVRTSIVSIGFLGIVILFILSPMWSEILHSLCVTVSADPRCSQGSTPLALFALVVFGLLAVVSGFKASSMTKSVMQGYCAYREQRGLPRFQ